jgi:hypothetical protein
MIGSGLLAGWTDCTGTAAGTLPASERSPSRKPPAARMALAVTVATVTDLDGRVTVTPDIPRV